MSRRKRKTHGMTNTPTYKSWVSMKSRCNAPEGDVHYERYAGRGITVCERWQKFENFYEDMGERPAGHTIDRIDNDKGYFKENCQWATPKQQAANTHTTVLVEFRGGNYTLAELAEIAMRPLSLIRTRHGMGWDGERIVTAPYYDAKHLYYYEGEMLTVAQLAKKTGITLGTVKSRAARGWTVDEIVNTPIRKDRRYHE